MGGDKNPPNGTPPLLNLQNVQIDTEPNCSAAAVAKALSEIRIHRQNLDKADHGFATFGNPATFSQDFPRKNDGRSVVLCEGFSIRGYVAKVRSVDMRKCWPLSETLLEDSLREGQKPPLPPLVRPNYRWWSCHQCLEMSGQHKHFGASFDRCISLSIERPENNSKNFDHIVEQQLTVSLDTDPKTGPGFSQDLDEQIRKLSTVKISGEHLLNISRSEDAVKNIENKSERVEKHGRNIIVLSCIKDGHLKIEARKFTSVSDGNVQVERLHKHVKADGSDGTKPHNQTQAKKSTFDLIERESDSLNDVENGKEKAKEMTALEETTDQAGTRSVSLEFEGSKIDNQDSEITKMESRRHNSFDIGNSEGSGVKICPVCSIFTSATITAVNAHMDNCLAQVSMMEKKQVRVQKQKLRTRKKRSMVDICAASPPVQMSLEHLDNLHMDGHMNESAGSHGMNASSNLAVEVNCKRKQSAEAHYSIESGKSMNRDRQPESLETKRKRQRLGTITCVLGSKDVKETLKTAKMASSSTQSTERRQGVEHHVNDSIKPVKFREDSNGERPSNDELPSSIQLNSDQHSEVARDMVASMAKNRQQRSATFMEDITPHPTTEHSTAKLPEEPNSLKCSNHSQQRGERGKVRAEESTREPSSVPAISGGTVKVSKLYAVGETAPSWNESPHVQTEKHQELGNSGCTYQNRDSIESCRLQVEKGSPKQGDQNFIKKRHFNGEASCINPGKIGGSEELYSQHGIATCSKFSVVPPIGFVEQTEDETGQQVYLNHNLGDARKRLCLQSVDRTRANTKDLTYFQKDTLISETMNIREGPIKNARLNLNQRVSVLPRDSKGRFISSGRMNGGKCELSFSRWKQADSHKVIKRSKNSVNTSVFPQDTNVAMTAALSNARIGKPTSMQTFIPFGKDYHVGKKGLSRYKSVPVLNGAVAGQAGFASGNIEIFSVGREAPLAITTLNCTEAPFSGKAVDLAKFFIQSRCSDYGYISLPLDSQGELIKYIPNTTTGVDQHYRIQNSTTDTKLSVRDYSKRLPEFNMVESMDVCNNISEVGRTLKISSDSILCNFKCPSLKNDSIRCKHSDCCHQCSVSKIKQCKPKQACLVQSSSLNQTQREYVKNSQIRTSGTSIRKEDTSSTLTVCMHSTLESGCNGAQKKKSSLMEQNFPEVQNIRKAQPIPQPVMRLMGHNFTIGGENEAGNSLKEYKQGRGKEISSISEATLGVSSSIKSNSGRYTACSEGQLFVPYSGLHALRQHSIGKSHMSDFPQNNFKQMDGLVACNTTEEQKRLSSSVPKLVEKRFPASCVPCEQSFRGQSYSDPAWRSTSAFCTPIANTLISPVSYLSSLISPVSHLSSNTCVYQGDNMAYKYSCNPIPPEMRQFEISRSGCNFHAGYFQNTFGLIRDPARLHQNQVYSENQNSNLVRQAFPIPVGSGSCLHTCRIREAPNNSGSILNQSGTIQSLQNNSRYNAGLPQSFVNARNQKQAKERTRYNKKQFSAPVPSSKKMESVTNQSPCLIRSSVSFSDPVHGSILALAHPTSFQTASPSHCETLNSSASPTDSAGFRMHGRYKHSSTTFFGRDNMKLPRNMSRNICAISHEKGRVPDTVNLVSPESKRQNNPRRRTRREIVQQKNGLTTKCLRQRHEGSSQGPSKKCELFLTGQKLQKRKRSIHHEITSSSLAAARRVVNRERSGNDFIDDMGAKICIVNANSVEFAMGKDSQDGENCSNMNKVNDSFSKAFLNSAPMNKKRRESGGAFRKPKNNFIESQLGTFRVGLQSSNTESSLKWAEPMKLSAGAKHILKPPSPNGNANRSLPIHYTLPFAETTAEERGRYLHAANRYSGAQQRSPPGSKLLRWASRSNNSVPQIPSIMETADCHPQALYLRK